MSTKSTPAKARAGLGTVLVLGLALLVVVQWPTETADFVTTAAGRLQTFVTELTTR
ncbi:hypothetical protein GCM10027174_45830 [Salinifilum aidingensis]